MTYNHLDYGCKGSDIRTTGKRKRAISEETTLYFDVSQKII